MLALVAWVFRDQQTESSHMKTTFFSSPYHLKKPDGNNYDILKLKKKIKCVIKRFYGLTGASRTDRRTHENGRTNVRTRLSLEVASSLKIRHKARKKGVSQNILCYHEKCLALNLIFIYLFSARLSSFDCSPQFSDNSCQLISISNEILNHKIWRLLWTFDSI